MSTLVFHRPARQAGPLEPRGDLQLESPPEVPQQLPRSIGQILMLLPMLAGTGAMAFMFAGHGGGTLTWVMGGLMGVSMMSMGVTSMAGGGGNKAAELDAERRDYMRYLTQMRRRVRRAAEQQRSALLWRHPAPDALWSVAASKRMWERRPGDEDFGEVRVGVGALRLSVDLVSPETKPVDDLEPMTAIALRRFMNTFRTVPDLPTIVNVRGFSRMPVRGDREAGLALVRSMLCQLATLQAPDELRIAVVAAPDYRAEWDWVKWLPHAQYARRSDAAGPVRMLVHTMSELEDLLGEEMSTRQRHSSSARATDDAAHLVVVLDGGEMAGDAQLAGQGLAGATLIDLAGTLPREMGDWTLPVEVHPDRLETLRGNRLTPLGRPDAMSRQQAEGLARQLAPYRQSTQTTKEEPLAKAFELVDLVGVGDAGALDVHKSWRPNKPNRERLRLPLGLGPGGNVVELDIKEAAQGGMGPHGLIIGATGSGKSELLRTIVSALAMTHSTDELNFVLVDFKGGATFASLDVLPHTSAVITNLEDELPLVDRMQDALEGEMVRRQELLRAAGNYVSQYDYEKARRAGEPLEPLPALMVVCDEFSELLSAKPDFIDLFVMIGRLGRSLGVHLLLASQRLEEGKLRGLDTHLSYRIGLRTFSSVESRIVLGVSDAYELPNAPGHGYLKSDTSTMLRFRAAYVSGPYEQLAAAARSQAAVSRQVVPFSAVTVPVPRGAEPAPVPEPRKAEPAAGKQTTVLEVVASRLRGQGNPAHQVWLPPLDEPVPLDALLPKLAATPGRGLGPADGSLAGGLRVPVGIEDRPRDQRRDPYWADLSGAGGNVVVLGGPRSGKSTMLRALVSSLAVTHTPREVQFFCLDFGGGTLAALRDLPHVGGVAGRRDAEQVRRTVAEVRALLESREARFAEQGIDSIASYRRRRARGEFPDDPFGDLFLVVDGWGTVREDYEDHEQTITSIAQRGLGYGVHVVITASRWAEVRMSLRDLLGTRFELRLGDPSDSEIDRRIAANVPVGAPGRGITPAKLHFLSAVPRIDARSTVDDLADGVTDLVKAVADAWGGPGSPPVRLLPRRVSVTELPASERSHVFPLGLNESALEPVYLDFVAEPHLLVLGDAESGKTNLLRTLAGQITGRYPPERARLIVGDYRRSMLGAISEEHLLGYAPSSQALGEMIGDVAAAMRNRLPGPDVTPEQLRNRSWWKGPEVYVLIDDYDLVANVSGNPVAELAEYLPQSRDIGLHVVLARRVGGASRALYEPVIQRMRELDNPALLMSGNPEEGPLLGNLRPSNQPPGRGTLVRRSDGSQLIQVAWSDPEPGHQIVTDR